MPKSLVRLMRVDDRSMTPLESNSRHRPRYVAPRLARIVVALGLLLTACAHAPRAKDAALPPTRCEPASETLTTLDVSTTARPPFFRVEAQGGASLFLFGTIHLGPPEGWSLSPPVRAALEEAEALAFEIDFREATEEHVSTLVASRALFEPGTRLEDRLSPETLALLDQRAATLTQLGFPERIRSMMKPWFLALGILESQVEQTGYRLDRAADRQIFDALGARPLIAFETVEEQLSLFDALPSELQDLMLRDALTRHDEALQSIDDLVRAWHHGDKERLACLAREGVDELPGLAALYERVFDERNRAWLAQLMPRLEGPAFDGTQVFVAVGALHLVGPTSLPELLQEAGYRVVPIDQREAP